MVIGQGTATLILMNEPPSEILTALLDAFSALAVASGVSLDMAADALRTRYRWALEAEKDDL